MAYDYTDDVAFANEMITEYGRVVTLYQVVDAGPDQADPLADSSTGGLTSPPVMAAFVQPTSLNSLGLDKTQSGLFKSSTSIALIPADGVTDYSVFNFLTDTDGSVWKIENVSVFKPGPTVVLYYVGICAP